MSVTVLQSRIIKSSPLRRQCQRYSPILEEWKFSITQADMVQHSDGVTSIYVRIGSFISCYLTVWNLLPNEIPYTLYAA